MSKARSGAPVLLVAGVARLDLPFKGGVLVPDVDLVLTLLADASGGMSLQARWPAGIAGPFTIWLQTWIVDADAPLAYTASNGLGGLQP